MSRTVLMLMLVAVFAVLAEIDCKIFSSCELARSLYYNYKFSKASLGDWVCLVQHESHFKTDATTRRTDGSTDYGLFKINSIYCGQKHPSGECRALCSSFLNSDISDDIKCIKKIYKQHGFSAWAGWKAHCEGKYLPRTSTCF